MIYAGAREVEANGNPVTVKTYWPNGIGVEIDRPGLPTEMIWTHVDRLGSVAGLTNQNGELREKLAYDAWGKRRVLDTAATPDALDGRVDNRGFTGHEMLDSLDLVHMNGRVYDPLTSRFMSADAVIEDPENGQSYSRYSYVLNNPTNRTDPTGFSSCDSSSGNEACTATAVVTEKFVTWAKALEKELAKLDPATKAHYVEKTGQLIAQQVSGIDKGDGKGGASGDKQFYNNFRNGFSQGVSDASQSRGHPDVTDGTADKNSTAYLLGQGVGIGFVSSASYGGRMPAGARAGTAHSAPALIACKCFVAGTLVHTRSGLVRIENIKVGDFVAARNEVTDETAWKPVLQLIRDGEKDIVRVQYRHASGRQESLRVTPEHPFMLEGKRWVAAGDLHSGDRIMRLNGGLLTVMTVEKNIVKNQTYNFEVADFHTYFVGLSGAWVHNAPCPVVPKPSLEAHKKALAKVHAEVGKLPKGEPGKFGAPQAGNSKTGYRLDPPHTGAAKGDAESKHHFDFWDYSAGKRDNGGRSGAIPIEE